MRNGATAIASGLLAVAALAVAASSPRAEAQPVALRASGHASVSNSKAGRAILAGRLGPGDSISGTVTIGNPGTTAGNFTLGSSHVMDASGSPGSALSARLDLAIDDVTASGAPVAVYRGKLGSLPQTALGTFAPASMRTYRFTVTWVDGGASDSAYAGASMSVQFDWSTGSGGGGGAAAPPAGTPPRPRLPGLEFHFRAAKRQRVVRRRAATVHASCSAACTVQVTARLAVRRGTRAVELRPTSRALAAGTDTKLRIALPATVRRRLRSALGKHRRPMLELTATASGTTGSSSSVTRKVEVIG